MALAIPFLYYEISYLVEIILFTFNRGDLFTSYKYNHLPYNVINSKNQIMNVTFKNFIKNHVPFGTLFSCF